MSNPSFATTSANPWPSISLKDWQDTCTTLHLWTQIVGKIRLVQMPWTNHSWHVPLYVTARGLTTASMPDKNRSFQIDFDFIDQQLLIQSSDGLVKTLPLKPQSVADFYNQVMGLLQELDMEVAINTKPNEVADPIPFEQDREHASYDGEAAQRFWQALVQMDRVFKRFRARYVGKCSPVHFFWGSFDLAVTRFSGRPAPEHPGGVPNLPDWAAKEAYSQEVSSAGFWPGNGIGYPAFYSYAYPTPEGFSEATVRPAAAFYSSDLGEFVLPYEAVQHSESPDDTLLDFLQSTYEAAANLGNWNREALEAQGFPFENY
ncbi:MAG: DUF5996 family protein [Cyanophyceae cyanobacterium]